MRVIPVALLAALAVCTVPVAHAATAHLEFTPSFATATLDAQGQLEGNDAAALRRLIERSGTQDGTVTQEEADRFVSSFKGLIGQMVAQVLTGGNVSFDGNGLVGSEMGTLSIEGAAGPVESGPPIRFDLAMTFLFQPAEADTHTMRLTGHATPGGELEMTIAVPEGWHIESVDGLGAGHATGKEVRSVTFTMPQDGEFTVVFATDAKGTPVPFWVPVLGVLAALLVTVRQSRGAGRA